MPLVDLQYRDTYCLKKEMPVAGHLVHFLPFWEEVIQADCLAVEINRHGYSIELIRRQFQETMSTPPPLEGLQVLSNEVADLLRKGKIVLTPLGQVRNGYCSTYFLVPNKDSNC